MIRPLSAVGRRTGTTQRLAPLYQHETRMCAQTQACPPLGHLADEYPELLSSQAAVEATEADLGVVVAEMTVRGNGTKPRSLVHWPLSAQPELVLKEVTYPKPNFNKYFQCE